jgi:hypothetical protein
MGATGIEEEEEEEEARNRTWTIQSVARRYTD